MMAPIRHPIQTANALLDAQNAEAEKFEGAMRQVRDAPTTATRGLAAAEAVGHLGATALPLVGPEAARVGETLGRGETARGLGQATGLFGSLFLPSLLGKVPRSRTGTAAVPLTRSERSGSTMLNFAESLTERTVPGAAAMKPFRAAQQEALVRLANRTVDAITDFQGTSGELGVHIQIAIDGAMDVMKAEARGIYRQIDADVAQHTVRRPTTVTTPSQLVGPQGQPLTVSQRVLRPVQEGGVLVPTRTLKEFAIPALRRIRQEGMVVNPEELTRITGQLETIIGAPKAVGFQAFQDARSTLLAIVRGSGTDPIPGKAGGLASKLSGITDDAMMNAAETSKIPGLAKRVREANDQWSFVTETFNKTLVKRLIDASPEQLPVFLRTASLDDITAVKSVLPPEAWDDLRGRVMRDIVDDATGGELGGRMAVGGAQPAGIPSMGITMEGVPPHPVLFSGTKLSTALDKIGPDRLGALFGQEATGELLQVVREASIVGKRAGDMIPGLIAGGVNMSILAPIFAPLGISFGGVGTSAGLLGGFNLLGRVLIRQPGRAAYRDFLRAAGSGNRPSAIAAANRLVAEVGRAQEAETIAASKAAGGGLPPVQIRAPGQIQSPPSATRVTLGGTPPGTPPARPPQ